MSRLVKQVVIDGQILQTGAWHRGMGKYTLQVLKEMSHYAALNRDKVVFYVLLNNNLGIDKTRSELITFLCPEVQLIHASLPVPSDKSTSYEDYVQALDEQLSEALTHDTYEFFMTSLFFFDFYAEFPTAAHKSLLFYDLTPMLFWKDLGGYFPPELYMGRFRQVLEAQTIYAISDTTKNDVVHTFGLDATTVVNINGGFSKIADKAIKPKHMAVPASYVLMPTGDLPHKNNDVAIRGFERFVQQSGKQTKLLITSHFSDLSKQMLQAASSNILFTDNVSDEELEWLYVHADAVMFASKYEGLGIPILDAVANDKPVITSRIPVFEEMSREAFYYFDPESVSELALQLQDALAGKQFAQKQKGYPDIMRRYSWHETFRSIWNVMETDHDTHRVTASTKPKIAIVSLHPGIAQQAGRQAEMMHAKLKEHYEIDYYFDANGYYYREMERPTFLDFIANKTADISHLTLRAYKHYDALVYIVDDAVFPSRLMQRAIVLPGLMVDGGLSKTQLASPEYKLMEDVQLYIKPVGIDSVRSSIDETIRKHQQYRDAVKTFSSKRSIIKALRGVSYDT